MLTLDQIITPVTQAEALQTEIDILDGLGFAASSWEDGAIQLTFLNLLAQIGSGVTTTISTVAAGGFTSLFASSTAVTAMLTLLAKYVYSLDRLDANSTIGNFTLTSTASGTTTWNAGDIIVSNSPTGTVGAQTFTVNVGGSLGPSSSVSIAFTADNPGAAGNIAPNATLYLWTPIVGITATNPVLSGSNTWITTPGADPENDSRLVLRCIGRWSRLTYGNTNGAYAGWALEALPALTRVAIASAAGNGTVTLYGATSTGPINGTQITAIQNYIQGITDGVGRRPINDIFTAVAAPVATTPSLVISCFALANVAPTIGATITQALLNYFGTIPLGGVLLGGATGYILLSQIHSICVAQIGVLSVDLNITSDIALTAGQIYTPAITVNVTMVAPS